MRIQSTLITTLQNHAAVIATGAVITDRRLKVAAYPNDPEATSAAFAYGSPTRVISVPDPPAVKHPTDARQGYSDFWPQLWYYAPADDDTGLETIREAVFAALAGARPITPWGIPTRIAWVQDGMEPLLSSIYPNTMEDWTRYRVTTRREDEPSNGYWGRS